MNKVKKFSISILFITVLLLLCMNKSNAAQEYPELENKWFYIKNAYTGHYLDVYNGYGQNDTNVQQCRYNGSYAQKWCLYHLGNGEYMIYTNTGATTSGDTTYITYALDVYNGWGNNGTNIQIYEGTVGNFAQTFTLEKTQNATYIIRTKASNYNSVVSLSDNICDDGINVHEWEYSNHTHDQWIIEPEKPICSRGVEYAKANYKTRLDAYPDFQSPYYDCTNFVSQCLLAGGELHQNGNWYLRRKNTRYHTVTKNTELDYSWELSDPSPWISAKEFKNEFSNRKIASYTGKNIISKATEVWKENVMTGDVVQVVNQVLGIPTNAEHTMYVTGYGECSVDGAVVPTYKVTYHSRDEIDVKLINFVNSDKDYNSKLFFFYNFKN